MYRDVNADTLELGTISLIVGFLGVPGVIASVRLGLLSMQVGLLSQQLYDFEGKIVDALDILPLFAIYV